MGSERFASPSASRSPRFMVAAAICAIGVGLASVSAAQTDPVAPPPWKLETRPVAARAYMDLSESMRGYERGAGADLESLAIALKAAIINARINTTDAVGFGTSLDAPTPDQSAPEAVQWRADKLDTCLKLPIAEELRAHQAPKSVPRVMLVLTDGVASAVKAGACGKACLANTDQTCTAAALRDYIAAGYAFSVFGAKLRFTGTFFPAAGRGVKLKQPVNRPFYVWIGSPSSAVNRQILEAALAWAGKRDVEAMALELWPGSWRGYTLGPAKPSNVTAATGQLGVCVENNTISIDALPSGAPPTIRLRSRASGEGHYWAARIPLAESSTAPGGNVLSPFATSANVWFEKGKLHSWDWRPKERAALGCLAWVGPRAYLRLTWKTTVSPDWKTPLVAWSDEFGRTNADPARTEGFLTLWEMTIDAVKSITGSQVSPLLDLEVRGK